MLGVFEVKKEMSVKSASARFDSHSSSKWEAPMFDSVLPAESEPITVVSSRWLWAARFFALIYALSLVGEYVAEAHFDPLNPLVGFLFTFGLRSLLSLVLLYFLFRSGKKSLAFALGLGAATAFIALFGVASNALFWPLGRSINLSLALIISVPLRHRLSV
jgi:Na+-driven multidrug efflux pump